MHGWIGGWGDLCMDGWVCGCIGAFIDEWIKYGWIAKERSTMITNISR